MELTECQYLRYSHKIGKFPEHSLFPNIYNYNDYIVHKFDNLNYKIIQIVHALWLAIKPFCMSLCKHGFRSSFISYFMKEI